MSQTTISKLPASDPLAMMSYEEFLTIEGENQHLEWVNGRVITMAPISFEHQDVGTFLVGVLREYVETKKLGKVLYEPFQMKTGPDLPGRSPDILFVAIAHLKRLKKKS
jgi:Uma2 family endonuclease